MTMEPERPPLEATEPPTKVGSRQPAPLAQPIVEKVENVIDAPKHDMPAKKTIRRHAEATRVEGGNANGEEAVNPAGLGEKAIPYHQLPDDVKKSLSEIKVFLHCYSPESQERFVQINDHTLHEGQSRPDGLKVLRITQHKAILSFQGHRFYLQAVEK